MMARLTSEVCLYGHGERLAWKLSDGSFWDRCADVLGRPCGYGG